MEIIFLGTSAGMPTKNRNVSGAAIKKVHSKSWYLVDCGEGTQHQLLHTGLSLSRLSAIFITHVHGDHCYGLPGLLASATMSGRTKPLLIVAPKAIQQMVEQVGLLSHARMTYELNFIDVETLNEPLDVGAFTVDVTPLSHRVPSFAYGFTESQQVRLLDTDKLKQDKVEAGPIWGNIQKGQDVTLPSGVTLNAEDYLLPPAPARKIIISGDNDKPSLLAESIKTANVLVHEATYTKDIADKVGDIPQHSHAKLAAEFAEQAGVDHLILTHFSSRYPQEGVSDISIKDIELEARTEYQGELFLANDFDVYRLDRFGSLAKVLD